MTRRIEAIGVSVDVPNGWEAEIDTGAGAPSVVGGGNGGLLTVIMPRLHAANFALPLGRGDFGSGAVERMGRGHVLVCVLEEDGAMASTKLYEREGVPRLTVDDFDPQQMQRPLAGQSGAQAFFRIGDRAFVLYIALGDHAGRALILDQINEVLSTLRFS